jgi:membrane protein DedA with SNARE-associated domain
VGAFLEHFGYAAILGVLLAAGAGVPLPEELTLLTSGVLAHEGVLRLPIALAVGYAGVVGGDAIAFTLGRRHGEKVLSSRLVSRVLTPERRARLDAHFTRHAFLTVAVARHLGGVRAATFALAGAHGVPLRTFLLADTLSAILSVPTAVGAGYLFSRYLHRIERDVRVVELALAAVVVGVVVARLGLRARRARSLPPSE